jgi:hypothetical protein
MVISLNLMYNIVMIEIHKSYPGIISCEQEKNKDEIQRIKKIGTNVNWKFTEAEKKQYDLDGDARFWASSQVDEHPKFSEQYEVCTGLIMHGENIARQPVSCLYHVNLSVLLGMVRENREYLRKVYNHTTHDLQNKARFLAKIRERFHEDLDDKVSFFLKETEGGERFFELFGGALIKSDDDTIETIDSSLYEKAIQQWYYLLKEIAQQAKPTLLDTPTVLLSTKPSSTSLYFDTPARQGYLVKPREEKSIQLPASLRQQLKAWKDAADVSKGV